MATLFLPNGSVFIGGSSTVNFLPVGSVVYVEPEPVVVDSTGWKPIGGDVSAWLEPLPPEVEEIIEEVAEAEAQKAAVKGDPGKAPMKPLRLALSRQDYQLKTDYAEVYRRAYQAALDRIREEIRQDDEEVLLIL